MKFWNSLFWGFPLNYFQKNFAFVEIKLVRKAMKQLSILIPVHFCQRNCINLIFFFSLSSNSYQYQECQETFWEIGKGGFRTFFHCVTIGVDWSLQRIADHPSFSAKFLTSIFVLTVVDSAAKYQNALSQLLKIIMSALCQLLSTLLTHAHWFIDAIKVLGFFQ